MATVHLSLSAFCCICKLISALLVWLLLLQRVHAQNRSDEVRSLLSFKEAYASSPRLYGINYWSTWNESDENPCLWIGVTCTANSTVSDLDLSGWGWIQDSAVNLGLLSSLKDLRRLDLSNNLLEVMPEGVDSLTGLILLDVSQNGMQSTIPNSISAWRSLRFLYLQGNFLFGEIPSLSGLVNLQILVLAGNELSGPFPKEVGDLQHLVSLDLSDNRLNGTIPPLPHLLNLVDLRLDYNSFTEFEQDWLLGSEGANSSLQQLHVAYNQLQGTIPSSIINLLNLQVLNMSGNQLSGRIPIGFSRQLQHPFSLDFSQNQLTGEIPDDFLQQSKDDSCQSFFNLSYNILTGGIPIDGAKYICFDTLDFSHNNLSGPIPLASFDRAENAINKLFLQNNQLSGDIVDVMFYSPGVWTVFEAQLQNNRFTGDLSRIVNTSLDKLQGWTDLLDLSNNYLQWSTSAMIPDPIQATLETLTTGVISIRVGGNNFSGTSLPKTCFLSSTFIGSNSLQILDISNSQLNGEIFGAAFNSSCLSALEFLNVSYNAITGSVPYSTVMLPNLAVMDVSYNHLSGPLPLIPQNSSLNEASFFEGNGGLCGPPLPACPHPGSGLQWWVLLITISGSLSIALMSCLAATWRWRVYQRLHQQDADLIKTLMERDSATLLSLRELRKATNNFDAKAKIGEGGFGTVYKGRLNNGKIVAIKKSKREGTEKDKEQFLNEVRILSQVNHRNLVKLMGCSMENKTAVLVFEFVSNGTLQEHLQGKIDAVRLTWKQRLNIAVQTADALNYLHSAATFPIYHRDVKSANILLSDDVNAKVADFGISRLAPVQATHVSTAAVQGTMGYIDPEYYTSYQLTDKSDVYSFGVVLLELISAKPALDFGRGGEDTGLVNFAGPFIERGNLEGLIDPTITETLRDLAGPGGESILNVGKLAMKCLDMQSKARPSMNEVLKELQNFWLDLHGRSTNSESMKEGDDEDARRDSINLLPDSFYGDSSSFTLDSDSIQLSQFSSTQ